ncbi:O-acetylhomoserine aminocarboxypropyltransferase/cysteine synthase family protein [Aureibacillus halotolerans]|uniref:O-acetylhomoserine sulfhydrylase n=1 Tax=Aureibacillus halotolerans TaxID=1508390 RepID=A0A4R6UBK1_9BACI|nr:O-acetylhomoserine aminocarboxypropyltransferase/cysteine synthase family protein [Aureibacillus halotolerans]TDQ40464.1 O-acetylhomoserine sulfhydrylase [Aureibacillus halotolerans]
MSANKHRFETIGVHGGLSPDPVTGARALPIYQSNAYAFKDPAHAANLFGLQEEGYIYSRIHNPTVAVLEERVAQLEQGVAGLALASGMAAISTAILTIAGSGDEIIASNSLYGGTYNLFAITLPRYGIKTKFVDLNDKEKTKAAFTTKTKAVFAEAIGNPSMRVLDIKAVADVAHENGVPLIVDNTFPTPYLLQPLVHGADIVVHSATKWIGGNGTSLGGIIVDGGHFDWNSSKYPGFTEPDQSYNGIVYAEAFGNQAFIVKARVQVLRDLGAAISPFNAFQLALGLETLHVRMKEHIYNTRKVVSYLTNHPKVTWVSYPELSSHPDQQHATTYLPKGAGAVIVFGIQGGRDAGVKLIEHVELWSHLANVGDAKSLIIHPASTTHQQLSKSELDDCGISEDLIRLSVGIEHIDDLIEDLDQAFAFVN